MITTQRAKPEPFASARPMSTITIPMMSVSQPQVVGSKMISWLPWIA